MMARTYFLVTLFTVSIACSQAQVTVSTVTGEIYGSGGMSRGPTGRIYIANIGQTAANERGTEVLRYDPVADTIGVFATGLRSPSGNAFDSQGNFFQSNSFGSEVSIIDSNGTVNTFTIAGLFSPQGIAVDSDDNLYVCNCGNNTVQRITPSKASSVFSSHPEFNCPHGIAIDAMGTLYMANFNDGKVFRIDTLGIGTLLATIPGGNNGFITYNPGNGALYVNSLGSSTLYLMTTEGLFSPFVGTGTRGNQDGPGSLATLSRPNGLALSVTGDSLYLNSLVSLTTTSLPRNPVLLRRITGLLPPPAHIAVPDLPLATVKAYPNPVVHTLQVAIEARAAGPAYFRLYALDGRLLLAQQATLRKGANTNTISLPAGLAAGVYQLQVAFNGQHVARNMVVEQQR